MTGQQSAWLIPPATSRPGAVRLFCFPYAGGNAGIFRDWPSLVPAGVEIWPVELPGRARRLFEDPIDSCSGLAEECATAIAPFLGQRHAFFGHSMGGLLGFEVARTLRGRGAGGPGHFFASGCRAPHVSDRRTPIHALPQHEFLRALNDFGGTPREVLESSEDAFEQILEPQDTLT
ncbi:MAG: thioesterase domain-containing protein [Deltaproteobacteria bacterium]